MAGRYRGVSVETPSAQVTWPILTSVGSIRPHLDVEAIEARLHLGGFNRRAGSPLSSPPFALPTPDQRHQHRSDGEFADLGFARKFSEIAAGARDRCRRLQRRRLLRQRAYQRRRDRFRVNLTKAAGL